MSSPKVALAEIDVNIEIEDIEVTTSQSGNISFEVPVKSPRSPLPVKSPLSAKQVSPRPQLSAEELQAKLDAAEQRRLAQEAEQKSRSKQHQEHIEAVQKLKEARVETFKAAVQDDLQAKLDVNKENRHKQLAEISEKAKREEEKVKQANEQREALRSSLGTRFHELWSKAISDVKLCDEATLCPWGVEKLQQAIQFNDEFCVAGKQFLAQIECEEEAKAVEQKLENATKCMKLMNAVLIKIKEEPELIIKYTPTVGKAVKKESVKKVEKKQECVKKGDKEEECNDKVEDDRDTDEVSTCTESGCSESGGEGDKKGKDGDKEVDKVQESIEKSKCVIA